MFFFAKLIVAAVAIATQVSASPAPFPAGIATESELLTWLSTTDATLTFIGDSVGMNSKRAADSVMVVYCSDRTQNVCGGPCSVYNGGAACLNAPNTNCLSATANVGFCDHGGCSGSCNQFSTCGTRLDNNFCFTPGTNSIIVPPS